MCGSFHVKKKLISYMFLTFSDVGALLWNWRVIIPTEYSVSCSIFILCCSCYSIKPLWFLIVTLNILRAHFIYWRVAKFRSDFKFSLNSKKTMSCSCKVFIANVRKSSVLICTFISVWFLKSINSTEYRHSTQSHIFSPRPVWNFLFLFSYLLHVYAHSLHFKHYFI